MIRKKAVATVKISPLQEITVNHIWAEGIEIYSIVDRNPKLDTEKQPFVGITFPVSSLDDVIEALHTARRLK